ncbi:hypothetical protein FJY90_02355 [Candidatus Gottesmanbacteria bacterium]|nr:hypothetical protein [Candidatus Gottesmanbacteria bacterium]
MAITFPALLKAANFPKEKVDELMKNIDFVPEDEKLKLSNLAWYFISRRYFLILGLEKNKLLGEVEQGKRKYNPNDIKEIEAKLTHELVEKLEAAASRESIEEVKKELERYKTQPMSQDKTNITSTKPTTPPTNTT